MILDSSAIVAIMLAEPGYEVLLEKIGASEVVGVSAPTVVEAALVLSSRLGRDAQSEVYEFLRHSDAEVTPFTEEHVSVAVDAFLQYGKGRHPAALNFGDCLAYAAATLSDSPLLFTGKDFSRTDIRSA
jgi:ribonuclease VapC